MSPTLIAGLVKAQTPEHALCRAQEFIELAGDGSTMVVQCACNVRLTLSVPRSPESAQAVAVEPPHGKGEADGT